MYIHIVCLIMLCINYLTLYRLEIGTNVPHPEGCTMQTLGNKCQVYVLLKGLVDVPKEIARLEEKLQKLEGQIDKLVERMTIEGYEEKVILSMCGITVCV